MTVKKAGAQGAVKTAPSAPAPETAGTAEPGRRRAAKATGAPGRARILIPISNDIFVRNFVESGAFARVAEEFEIHYLLSSTVGEAKAARLAQAVGPTRVHRVDVDGAVPRTTARYLLGYVSMQRHPERSRTFPIKVKNTYYDKLSSRAKKAAFRVLSLPGVSEAFLAGREWALGTLPQVDQVLESVRPAFMLVPSAFSDSFSVDCLKSARAHGITHLMLMFNWDNVSCKGVLTVKPDHLAVWGEQTREQAARIHGVDAGRIYPLGSPQFEVYERPLAGGATAAREAVLRQNRLPLDRVILLYLGVARYRDEVTALLQLEAAIEAGRLPGAHVLYRPHPWLERSPHTRNFFDFRFKHVSMDAQLEDHYRRIMTEPGYSVKHFTPDYAYYPPLLNAADGVIASLTTMGIEAMLMGKPVLLPVFPDAQFPFSLDTLYHYEHHQCWRRFRDVITCESEGAFIADCAKLVALADENRKTGAPAARLKEDARYVVYHDEKPYAERLRAKVVELMEVSTHV